MAERHYPYLHYLLIITAVLIPAILVSGCTQDGQPGPINGDQTFCTEEQRNVDACIEIYQPVCGWSDPEKVQCITYPCASDYSNSCFACMDENVKYWTDGTCPEPGSGGSSSLLTREQALAFAEYSKCMKNGSLTGTYSYNEFTRTWWFDLEMNAENERQGCNPACVVWEETNQTEVNWRCTGLVPV